MKVAVVVFAAIFCVANSLPVAQPEESIDLINIPLSDNKELDVLTLAETDGTINERNKRTIGILRELFPELSKMMERKLQMIIQFAIRTFGPILLRGGLGGGTASTSGTSNRNNDDDFDDFEDDDTNEVGGKDDKVSISLPTFAPDSSEKSFESSSPSAESSPSRVRAVEEENLLEPSNAASEIFETIRVARETNNLNNNQNNNINKDQEPQASEQSNSDLTAAAQGTSSAVEELSLDSFEDDENRGKRFLKFGVDANANAGADAGGGSAGGSGNFLFDIIRLVSGSSGTPQTDESANGEETDVGKGDGYTEGIPGPVTRLFVLANRGLSNLIQDLILRVAQTSERIILFSTFSFDCVRSQVSSDLSTNLVNLQFLFVKMEVSDVIQIGTCIIVGAGVLINSIKLVKRIYNERPPTRWRRVGEISNLFCFPVKSCGPVHLTEIECGLLGPCDGQLRDRVFMVTRESGEVVTARTYPKMVLISPKIEGDTLTLSAPSMKNLQISISDLYTSENHIKTKVWEDYVDCVDCGDESAKWFSQYILNAQEGLRFVFYPSEFPKAIVEDKGYLFDQAEPRDTGTLHDETSFMLMNQGSFDDLNTRLEHSVTPLQYRPNFVVNGPKAWEEDDWKWLKIGDKTTFKNVQPCIRCIFTNIDPITGERSPNMEPLKTLKTFRTFDKVASSPWFGIHLGLRTKGNVKVGDSVYVGY
ncbi:CLUMA_CG004799, isoform A [Clunio marinus]|uniref:CLUMA_CG004799, isoform A n=1 Tax=Clunio marinus TaxID=568069 RepID=A0A1J1HSS7_9DIPT|nr:CLUMA_CG004799, isoform A [Clunio marinus]